LFVQEKITRIAGRLKEDVFFSLKELRELVREIQAVEKLTYNIDNQSLIALGWPEYKIGNTASFSRCCCSSF
jgi:hypothetical protein